MYAPSHSPELGPEQPFSTLEPSVAAPAGHNAPEPYFSAQNTYTGGMDKEVVNAGTAGESEQQSRPWSHRKRWIASLVLAAAASIGLIVGLAVGLTRRTGADSRSGSPTGTNSTGTTTSTCVKGPLCRAVLSAASMGSPASIFVFALGEGRAVFYRRGDGVSTWTSDWTSLGGAFTSPPAAIEFTQFATSTLGVFGLASPDRNLMVRLFRNGEFSQAWENLGAAGARSHITLCKTPSSSNEAHSWFTHGADATVGLYHKYWNTDPETLPSPAWRDDYNYWPRYREVLPASAVGLACRNATVYHEIAVYTQHNGSVTHTDYSALAGWSPWNNRGGRFIGDPVLVAPSSSRTDFFGIGIDKAMYHYTVTTADGFSPLDSLGGSFASIPSVVVSRDGNRLDIVALGRDGRVKHRAMRGSVWGRDWEDLGGVAGNSAPLAVNVNSTPPHVAVFVIGEKGDIMFASWAVSDNMSWTAELTPWTSMGGNFSVNYDQVLLPVNAVGL